MAPLYTPKHKKWDQLDHLTPNVELNEGIRPWLGTSVDPNLSLARYNSFDDDYFVLSTGKVIALDTRGFVTLAGLKVDLDAVIAAGDVAAATHLYTATDVAEAVKNHNGDTVTLNEPIVASMCATGSLTGATGTVDVRVSFPIGIAPYSYYRASSDQLVPAGGDATHAVFSPTDLRYHNYKKQGRVACVCDIVAKYPICATYAPTFAGIAAYVGQTPSPGDWLTYDIDSNLALADVSNLTILALMGQVLRVETNYPRGYLERVKTRYDGTEGPEFNDLDKMPGSATGGYPDNMTYANTSVGTLIVNFTTR